MPDPPVLPTRLLNIDASSAGTGLRVQLHLTSASKVEATAKKYATLSYCWGGPQEFQLNTESESMLMAGFPASLLPKTLHDAVQVAWDLEIRWIWIDSLCIRQDDVEDKATDVARMHLIYGSSFVTISASRASSCAQGFLHQSSLPAPATVGYKIPFASPSKRLGSVILSKLRRETSPIDNRGWTLQEHLLAHRVVRFTDYQLHWACMGTSLFERENPESLPSAHVRDLSLAYEMYKGIRDKNRGCRHWMNIVQEYTRRRLTDGSDKLPAMSGIAESWARTSKEDEYLAGLWKSHLPLGLLWTCAQPFRLGDLRDDGAPSWSWASLVGQVDWFDHIFTEVDPRLQVLSCAVAPALPQAPYGAVQSGYLLMQGLLQRTVIDDEPVLPGQVSEEDEYLNLDLADVHLDYWDEMLASKTEGAKIFCLQICTFDHSTGLGPSGLILATKDDKEFSRVGFFTFEPPQQYDVEELGDFDQLLALSEARQFVQRSAFRSVVPRSVKII
ncbi:heterokaryon incompatibility protein-domain-containing protein [Paraphoma chrysanthemicola]|nr:heterokaryon incompatibility protein-domain-containing protein [Paraphoma chrysanthemicola]